VRQQIRRYADKPPAPSGGSNSTLLYFLGGGAVAAGGYYYFTQNPGAEQKAEAKVKGALPGGEAKKALTGGDQGFVSLKLDDVEIVNHNTKKFRFKLPEDDMVSGLEVASAILTKFKPEGDAKPVLRPYTPTSDEG
jgi:cytochrome-b5 reductase